jgi:subtilisin family serine protease
MNGSNRRKIDPRLRRHALPSRIATAEERNQGTTQAFIEVNDAATRRWLQEQPWITKFVHLVEGYCTATVKADHLDELAEQPGVLEVEAVHYVQAQLHQSLPSIHGWDGMSTQERLKQGAGAVIGIVDYGLDFRLRDFLKPGDGSTRIAYLWDQELECEGNERPPRKYGYGVEYSRAHIDAALQAQEPSTVVRHNPLHAETNIRGHGTHVAGIAAGNGQTFDAAYPAGTYLGVAPGATLVFVHLARHAIVDQVNSTRGTLANSVDLAHAVAYCFEKADELQMPCVVNLSMGFNGGGHDGNMAVEWIMDELLSKAGRAVVVAAGNEHYEYKQIHYGGWVRQGQRADIRWDIGYLQTDANGEFPWGDPTTNEVEIWYSNQCKLRVELVAPGDNQAYGWIEPDAEPVPYRFDGGEQAIISSDQQTPWEGAARIHIRLSPGGTRNWIRCGTWIIRLQAMEVSASEAAQGVRLDAWIERTIPDPGDADWELWSRFRDYDRNSAITLTTPSTARRVIAVASCNSSEPLAISQFSGRGGTRDGRDKPEIAAPGDRVTSANAGAGRGNPPAPARRVLQGTSMAAPHVTGIVARLLSRQHYLTWGEIRDLLVSAATLPQGTAGPWHPQWGHGRVDAAKAMRLLEERLR